MKLFLLLTLLMFADSAWPVVQNDFFPAPLQPGDGFVWVRQRVTVPAGDAALWLRLQNDNWIHLPTELRVDGEVDAGLPLGIANGVEYLEPVTRGERFTIVSDGVVEAPNALGELVRLPARARPPKPLVTVRRTM